MNFLGGLFSLARHEWDTVLDPFLGSGTTSAVTGIYGRNSIGIEVNKEYPLDNQEKFLKEQKTLNDTASLRVIQKSGN